jgi:hypothetical protein
MSQKTPNPPFNEGSPLHGLEIDNTFTPLWRKHFGMIGDELDKAAAHEANTDNPHETSDGNIVVTDVTTNDVSIDKHGFAPKAPDNNALFLDGTGAYSAVDDVDVVFTNVSTNNASITAHGFCPILSNSATDFLNGVGTFSKIGIFKGSFTMSGTDSKTISDVNMTATAAVMLCPSNQDAGELQGSTKHLYVTNKTTGAFDVNTSDATNAGSSETFDYLIIQ